MAKTFGAVDKKKRRKPRISDEERQRRREQMKNDPAFDHYKGFNARFVLVGLSTAEAYYIENESKRNNTSFAEIVRSCIDYVIINNIIIK